MKKIFTLVAMATLAVAASAQVSWKGYGTAADDATAIAGTSTNKVVVADNITCGDGVSISGVQKTHKVNGTNTSYFEDATIFPLKFAPTNAQVAGTGDNEGKSVTDPEYQTLSGGVTHNQFVDFHFAVADGYTEDYLKIAGISFKATRIGTDDVRMNVRIFGEGDSDYDSGWLITSDNATSVISANGGVWQAATTDGYKEGYQPSREDDSKTNSNSSGYDVVTIPAPTDIPADLYDATIEVVIYGISNNKAAAIMDMTVYENAEDMSTGISEVATEAAPAKAAKKIVNGQLVIEKNGKKYTVAGAEL